MKKQMKNHNFLNIKYSEYPKKKISIPRKPIDKTLLFKFPTQNNFHLKKMHGTMEELVTCLSNLQTGDTSKPT